MAPADRGSGQEGRFGVGAAASAPGTASGQAGGGPGRTFDPARFAELRAKLCATPAGETPDLSRLPEGMLARLKGADGQIDPAKVAATRERFCNADGTPREGAGAARLDPERFAALRKLLCDDPNAPIDVAGLPEEVQARLRGRDGQVDPARLAQFRARICAMPQPAASERGEGSGRGAGRGDGPRGGGGGGMRFGGGRGGDGQGRWNLSLYHTIELQNEVLVAAGGPFLDLLNGDALGEGGVSRHKLELQGGVFYKGVGARLSANYLSGSTVEGSGLPGSSDLRFGDLATFDLRLFVNLEQQKWLTRETPGFWKGARFSLGVDNLLDAHQRVTDENGVVPLRYQPALIDPRGRSLTVEFRKMF
jgi:hypothetical protein